ncbi:MAG: CbbY, protein of unknown function linked to the Calvin-Benson-Bassham cycle, HAD-like hydrolase [Pseudomonadota bacterium]|jgi:HAD superfamily hydrolase (TIGR01509 family)
MTRVQALLWDVDGTMAETERDGHRVAFNESFEALGLPWRWDEDGYGDWLRITGGLERVSHFIAHQQDAPALADERAALARRIHQVKNERYARRVEDGVIPLRPGVKELMAEARAAGLRLAITSSTSRSNLDALMRAHFGPRWAGDFAAVVCREDVDVRKPEPDTYRLALQRLALPALACVAIEDSPGGAAAARAADVPVIVTRSHYFAQAPIEGAIAIGPGLDQRLGWMPALRAAPGGVGLADLLAWAHDMNLVSAFG